MLIPDIGGKLSRNDVRVHISSLPRYAVFLTVIFMELSNCHAGWLSLAYDLLNIQCPRSEQGVGIIGFCFRIRNLVFRKLD
jgi:hypothetical protein